MTTRPDLIATTIECPICGAPTFEPCRGGETHEARLDAAMPGFARVLAKTTVCPTCGAGEGELCDTGEIPHADRAAFGVEILERAAAADAQAAATIPCRICGVGEDEPCEGGTPHPERVAEGMDHVFYVLALSVSCPECRAKRDAFCVGTAELHAARFENAKALASARARGAS